MKKYYCVTCDVGQKVKEQLMYFTQSGIMGPCVKCGEIKEMISAEEHAAVVNKTYGLQRFETI